MKLSLSWKKPSSLRKKLVASKSILFSLAPCNFENIFVNAPPISIRDAETYVKCFEYFAQDKNSVYHHFKLLEKMIEDAQIAESGLDAATKRKNIFEDFDIKWYGRERGHLYNKNHIIA